MNHERHGAVTVMIRLYVLVVVEKGEATEIVRR